MEATVSLLFFHICIFILSFSDNVFNIKGESAIVGLKCLIISLSFISIWTIFTFLFKDTSYKKDTINTGHYENIHEFIFEMNPNGIIVFNDSKVIMANSVGKRMMREKVTLKDEQKYHVETGLGSLMKTALKSEHSFHVSNYRISNEENEYFFDIDVLSGYYYHEKIGALIIKENENSGICDDSRKNVNSNIKNRNLEKASIDILDKISHEIRTPLNNLQGVLHNSKDIINTIEDEEIKNGLSRDFEIYDRNLKRIQKLTDSFIRLVGIKYNDKLYFQSCDLINIIRSLSEASMEYAIRRDKRIDFFSSIDCRFGAVDVDKFEKMILSLISNAVKFSDFKSIIYIRVQEKEEKLIIEISSSGKMIEESQKKEIFQLFNQGEKLLTRSTEGLGLGLYFVKEYIEMHNGNVEVRSNYNGYTVFTVYLPINNHEGISQIDAAIEKEICRQKVDIEFSDI